ncbi:MAG: hypothetical protein A2X96_02555 [Syntrophobacterales bacterium GWC2_56_13]|nr:MAG: hypothetical protein A2X96_02555 [Syntrophobacterales bacterium GWC2_56_13]
MFLQNRYVFNLLIPSSGVLPWDLACTLKGFNCPESRSVLTQERAGTRSFYIPFRRNAIKNKNEPVRVRHRISLQLFPWIWK